MSFSNLPELRSPVTTNEQPPLVVSGSPETLTEVCEPISLPEAQLSPLVVLAHQPLHPDLQNAFLALDVSPYTHDELLPLVSACALTVTSSDCLTKIKSLAQVFTVQTSTHITAYASLDFHSPDFSPIFHKFEIPLSAEMTLFESRALAENTVCILIYMSFKNAIAQSAPQLSPQHIFTDVHDFSKSISACASSLKIFADALERIFSLRVHAAQTLCDVVFILYDVFIAVSNKTLASTLPSLAYRLLSLFKLPGLTLSALLSWFGTLAGSVYPSRPDQIPQGLDPQLHPQGPEDDSPLIYFTGLIGSALLGSFQDRISVRRILDLCSLKREFVMAAKSFQSLMLWMAEFLPMCAQEWICYACPSSKLADMLASSGPLKALIREVYFWDTHAVQQRASWDPTFQNVILDRRQKFLDYLTLSRYPAERLAVSPLMSTINKTLTTLSTIVDIARHTDTIRKTPFCVCFIGAPGLGKSTTTPLFITDMTPPEFLDNAVYNRNSMLPFHEGYHGQYCTYFDDYDLIRASNKADSEHAEFLSFVSCQPHEMNMAGLEGKGRVFFNSSLVVMNTNTPYWSPKEVVDRGALLRRRHILCEVTVHPDYCIPGTTKLNRTLVDTSTPETIMLPYRYRRYDPVDEQSYPTRPLDSSYLTYQEFLHIAQVQCHQHYVNETNIVKTREAHTAARRKAAIPQPVQIVEPEMEWDNLPLDRPHLQPYFRSELAPAMFNPLAAYRNWHNPQPPPSTSGYRIATQLPTPLHVLQQSQIAAREALSDTLNGGPIFNPDGSPVNEIERASVAREILQIIRNLKDEEAEFRANHPILAFWHEHHSIILGALSLAAVAFTGLLGKYIYNRHQSPRLTNNAIIASGSQQTRIQQRSTLGVSVFAKRRILAGYNRSAKHALTNAGPHDSAQSLIDSRITSQCYLYHSPNKWMGCFFFSGKAFIAPSHFFTINGELMPNGTRFTVVTQQLVEYPQFFHHDRVFMWEDRDVLVYLCDIHVRGFKDSTHHFISEEHLKFHSETPAALLIHRPDKDDIEQRTIFKAKQVRFPDKKPANCYDFDGFRHYLTNVWEYTDQCFNGDCGSLLVSMSSSVPGKFLGLHVADSNNGSPTPRPGARYYSELITCEMLTEALQAFKDAGFHNSGALPCLALDPTNVEPITTMPGGNLEFLGGVLKRFATYTPPTTKIVPSILHNDVYPPLKAPAVLSARDPRNENPDKDLIARNIEKWATEVIPYDDDLYPTVKAAMLETVNQLVPSGPVRTLTLDEAVSGIPGYDYYDSINPHTSSGFYWSRLLPGNHGKSAYVKFDAVQARWFLDNTDLRQHCEFMLSEAKQGRRVATAFSPTLKDELRPFDRVKMGKTRVFAACDIAFTLVYRQLMLPFHAARYNSRSYICSSVGIDPYSSEWTELYNGLRSNSDNALANDISNRDGTVKPQNHDTMVSMANLFMNEGPELSQARFVMQDTVCHCVHVLGDICYACTHGNHSGYPGTVDLNSVSVESDFIYAWLKLAPPEFRNAAAFRRHIRLKVYGDDSIMTISDEVLSWFNGLTIIPCFATFGVTMTMADKHASTSSSMSLFECTFLKNGFRRDGLFIKATLDKDSIREMINWVHKTDEPDEQCIENCQTSLRMMYFHGFEAFNAHRELLRLALGRKKLYPALWCYEELDYAFRSRNPESYLHSRLQAAGPRPRSRPLVFGRVAETLSRKAGSVTPKEDKMSSPVDHSRRDTEVPARFPQWCYSRMANTRSNTIVLGSSTPQKLSSSVLGSKGPCSPLRTHFRINYALLLLTFALTTEFHAGRIDTRHIPPVYPRLGFRLKKSHGEPPLLRAQMISAEDSTPEPVDTAVDLKAGVTSISAAETGITTNNNGANPPADSVAIVENSSWDYKLAVERKNLTATFQWNTTDASLASPLLTLEVPADLPSYPLAAHAFEVYATWHGDVEVIVEVTGNPFFSGMLAAIYVPFGLDSVSRLSSYSAISQLTRVFIDASKDSAETLHIKYSSMCDALLNNPVSGAPWLSRLGYVYFVVWEQLQTPSNTPPSVTVTVSSRFLNATFTTPNTIPTTRSRPMLKGRGYGLENFLILKRKEEAHIASRSRPQLQAQGNTNSWITNTVSNSKDVALPTKVEGSQITPTLNADVSVPSLDRPSVPMAAPNIIVRAWRNLTNVSMEDWVDRMSMYPYSQTLPNFRTISDDKPPMDWSNLLNRWSWTEQFNITLSSTVNTPLTSGAICPCETLISSPPSIASPATPFAVYDFYAKEHDYWRGSIEIGLMFVMTAYHTCKIRVATHYFTNTVPGTLDQATSQSYHDITLNGADGERFYAFSLPFISTTPWKKVPNGATDAVSVTHSSCGVWSIRLLSALTATDTVPDNINCYVFQRAGPDMQFYGMGNGGAAFTVGVTGAPTLHAQGFESVKCVSLAPTTVRPIPHDNPVLNEIVKNPVDAMRRPCPYFAIESFNISVTDPKISPLIANGGAVSPFIASFMDAPTIYSYCIGSTVSSQTFVNRTIEFADSICAQAPAWRYYSGSMKYVFHADFCGSAPVTTNTPNSSTPPVALGINVIYPDRIQITWLPTDLAPNLGFTGTTASNVNGQAQIESTLYDGQVYSFGSTGITYATGISAINATRNPTMAITYMTPAVPSVTVEAPFNGVFRKKLSVPDIDPANVYPFVSANGIFFINADFPMPPSAYNGSAIQDLFFMPRIIVSRIPGDDFTFSDFIGFPPTFLNHFNSTSPPGKWLRLGYGGLPAFIPPSLSDVASKAGIRVGKKRLIRVEQEIEVDEEDDGGYQVIAPRPQLHAQGPFGDKYDPEEQLELFPTRTAAHFAYFINCATTIEGKMNRLKQWPTYLPNFSFIHEMFPHGDINVHVYTMKYATHRFTTSYECGTLLYQDEEPHAFEKLLSQFTNYIYEHERTQQDYRMAVQKFLKELVPTDSDKTAQKTYALQGAISRLNRVRQTFEGSSVVVTTIKSDLSQGAHAPLHHVSVELHLPDGTQYAAIGTASSVALAKANAAQKVESLVMAGTPTPPALEALDLNVE